MSDLSSPGSLDRRVAEKPSVTEFIKLGWQRLRERPGVALLFSLLLFVFLVLQAFFDRMANNEDGTTGSVIYGSAVSLLITSFGNFAWVQFVLYRARDEEITATAPFTQNWSRFLPFLLVSMLQTFAIIIGLLAFIVPGLYLAIRYSFAGYLILEKDCGIMEALVGSWNLTRGNVLYLVTFVLAAIGVAFLGLLCLVIGLIPAALVVGIAHAVLFYWLRDPSVLLSESRMKGS
jgi:hypothetical protein